MTDDEILRACAWRARRYASPGLERDDVLQEGRIALWLARESGRVPEDALHARRYLLRRVLGAMVDAHRTDWRQRPHNVDELTDSTPGEVAPEQPDSQLQMRQAVERVVANGSAGVVRCFWMLVDGSKVSDVARELHISESRVSQLRRRARELAAPCW